MAGSKVTAVMNGKDWVYAMALAVLAVGLFLLLLVTMLNVWDLALAADPDGGEVDLIFGSAGVEMSREVALLVLAATAGALGSFVYFTTSLVAYVGNRRFKASWVPWYLARPLVGAGLALAFYLVIRAGFLNINDDPDDINVYGIAAIALLSGLFAKQASTKLKQIFDAVIEGADNPDDSLDDSLTDEDDRGR